MRGTRILSATALAALTLAPAAAAQAIEQAATSLRGDPVYVDPRAERALSAADEAKLEAEIDAHGGGPIYVAVLPAAAEREAGGNANGVLQQLQQDVGRPGAYAVVVGAHFRAGSTDLPAGEAGRLATDAFAAKRGDGVEAVLLDWVDRVGDARTGDDGGGSFFGGVGLLPVLVVVAVAFFVYRSYRRRRTQAADFAAVRETARQDLVALADDVQELEQRVEGNPAAKRDYDAALEQYANASASFDRAQSPDRLGPVAEALEEGRYLMASVEARLEGREPSERRAACFFDPRHGPSVRDVEWAPPGGQPRLVPACAADALRVEEGDEPESRHVLAGGRMTPYWAAGPMYGGYFGGFFPGLLIGESLGGFGWGAPAGNDGGGGPDVGDFGSGGGFGDLGGGDFGGGDIGGGDIGGGDISF
jgi:hypothetical protein